MVKYKKVLQKYIRDIKSIEKYNEISSKLSADDKGYMFEELTLYIFKLHPLYVNFTKNIWLFNDLPCDLKTKLNLPETDQGIDLVLESDDNQYYAIQCKYRSNQDDVINWKELSTFAGLTFGVGNNFYKGFYVTNTYVLTPNIVRSNKIISLYGEFFNQLDNDFFDMINTSIYCNAIVLKEPVKPRNYQKTLLADTIIYFQKNDRGYIELACGMGKTLSSYWINLHMMNKMCIVLVPSLYLLSQFYKEWNNQSILEQHHCKYILVGSDADIDEENYHNNGLLLTTDPDEIQDGIKLLVDKYKYGNEENHRIIIISTYQSCDKLIKALKNLKIKPDLCIFDEAHKTVGQLG